MGIWSGLALVVVVLLVVGGIIALFLLALPDRRD